MNATDPNVGPLTALATAFLSALMVVLDAFNVFHITAVQQGDVLALAGTSLAVGLYVFSYLHQKTALTVPTLPAVTPAPPVVPPVLPAAPTP
jgi:ApbE superfamily uncharacterized protein (UPF0280 family)